MFHFVNPGLLGSREGFQKRFAVPIERDRDVHARQALRALIRPFLLRRTKAAVLSELPPRTEQTVTVEMAEPERVFYEALRQKAVENIAAMDAPAGRRKIQILAEITRLRSASSSATWRWYARRWMRAGSVTNTSTAARQWPSASAG